MSMVNCPECRKEISNQASSCPNCGLTGSVIRQKTMSQEDKDKMIKKGSVLKAVGVIALIIGIICAIYFSGFSYNDSDHMRRNLSPEAYQLYRTLGMSWEIFSNIPALIGWLIASIGAFSLFFGIGHSIQKQYKPKYY